MTRMSESQHEGASNTQAGSSDTNVSEWLGLSCDTARTEISMVGISLQGGNISGPALPASASC